MRAFFYMVLAIILLSILVTPLVEVFLVGREKMNLSSAIYNSFRAAKESSYAYLAMRNIDVLVDEETFLRNFAGTFATSFGMNCQNPTANPMRFVSIDDSPNGYNEYIVSVDFEYEYDEDRNATAVVTVTAESEYRFRTGYMQALSYGDANPFLITDTRTFKMEIAN